MLAACGTLQGVASRGTDVDGGDAATSPPAEASSDASFDGGDEAPMGADHPRYAFVTSATYQPAVDFVSLETADDRCNEAAGQGDPSIQGKKFLAWLSDSSASPSTRFVHSAAPYMRVTKGDTIAESWDDLVKRTVGAGQLAKKLDVTESGMNVVSGGNAPVWTATHADGTPNITDDCSEWTAGTGAGATGDATQQDSKWSDLGTESCATRAHLYCFEK
jgi:hypothetical protein